MKKNIQVHLPTLLFAVLIFVLSSIPDLDAPDLGFDFNDKIYHLMEYLIFGFLLSRSGRDFRDRVKYPLFVMVLFAGTLYAASDEIHQYFVPGRECDVRDFAADVAGIVLGFAGYWIIARHFRKISNFRQ